MIFTTLAMVSATNITINNTNNTLKNVVNSHDTIYLDDGIYNGSNNKNITISKNTTIIGLNKGSAIIDVGHGTLFTVNDCSLTLKNLIIKNGYTNGYSEYNLINNFGSLNIINSSFENNSYVRVILAVGNLNIQDSQFSGSFCVIESRSRCNITIKDTMFVNNIAGGMWGLIHVLGFNKSLDFVNVAFVNNTAYDSIISIWADGISLKMENSSFINNSIGSSDFIYMDGPFGPAHYPNNKDLKNIFEVGTKVNIDPYIDLGVYLKKNKLITLKATLNKFGEVIPNKRLYFYINGKLVGSALTDKNGVATFNIKRSNLNFTVQIVFNKITEENSTRTINYNSTSFKSSASKYVVGNSKVVLKLKKSQKKGKYVYKQYYVYNKGNSIGSKTITKKISSKYTFVKSTYKKLTFKYKKSNKTFSVKVKNLLPYKFNKKSVGVLTLVLKKR
jgi:hypothetical protein